MELEEEALEEEGLKEKLSKLRKELAACRNEKEEYLAGWQRAKADFINARKHEEKDRETFLKFAELGVLNDFLAIADSLALALKLQGNNGLREIYSQLLEILRQHGVTPLEAQGKKFNPLEHEAIERVEVSDEDKDEMVVEEMSRGWKIGEKVLRPAKVKVSVLKK